jgi:hypothetical protein
MRFDCCKQTVPVHRCDGWYCSVQHTVSLREAWSISAQSDRLVVWLRILAEPMNWSASRGDRCTIHLHIVAPAISARHDVRTDPHKNVRLVNQLFLAQLLVIDCELCNLYSSPVLVDSCTLGAFLELVSQQMQNVDHLIV